MDKNTLFILKVILAIILPPVALYDKGWKLILIDFLLCFLGYWPGIIMAMYIVLKDRGVFK